jgi:hypothetical protein
MANLKVPPASASDGVHEEAESELRVALNLKAASASAQAKIELAARGPLRC